MSQVYEQTGDYMPRTDDGFWHWLQNFSSLLHENPQRFALTAADAQIVMDHFDAYTPLWRQCKQPSLRTTTLIARKDAVKASAMASCRVYAKIIKGIPGVDEESKTALGLRINDTTPTPISVPSTVPMLSIVCAYSGEHVMRYADETTPTSRRKPHGAKFIEIWCNIAKGPNPDVSAAKPVGSFGRQPIRVALDQAHTGDTATYFGRWINTKGEPGPWSLPVTMTVSFGGPMDVMAGESRPKKSEPKKSGPADGELKIAA
ncbi:MAG: hypothetical protein EA377_00390 [Phycisphaerales bacterium]|nr:MAG: hypothetical protein EA377_00390 [Phycisphaerales bacterium]